MNEGQPLELLRIPKRGASISEGELERRRENTATPVAIGKTSPVLWGGARGLAGAADLGNQVVRRDSDGTTDALDGHSTAPRPDKIGHPETFLLLWNDALAPIGCRKA